MHFDATVSLGTLISLAFFVATLVTLHRAGLKQVREASETMARIELKIDTMWEWWITHQRGPKGETKDDD